MGIRRLVKDVLTGYQDKRYEKALAARKMTYPQWVEEREKLWRAEERNDTEKRGSAEEEKSNAEALGAELVSLCGKGGEITLLAEDAVKQYFAAHPQAVLVYGDEDVKEEGKRQSPWFKPDWSPDTLRAWFYLGHTAFVRRDWLLSLVGQLEELSEKKLFIEKLSLAGQKGQEISRKNLGGEKYSGKVCEENKEKRQGIVNQLEQSDEVFGKLSKIISNLSEEERQLLVCRLCELAGGFEKKSNRIGHIPLILFHSKSPEEQRRFLDAPIAGYEKQWERSESSKEEVRTSVSIIIPSKDHPALLEQCIFSVLATCGKEPFSGKEVMAEDKSQEIQGEKTVPEKTNLVEEEKGASLRKAYSQKVFAKEISLEFIIVDNGSTEENKQRIEAFLGGLPVKTQYLYRPMEFDFAGMCNLGEKAATGKLLLFLNDDVECREAGWLAQMAQAALRPYVGAVGLKLYYPGGKKLQHDGIVNLPMGPVHKLQFLTDDREYYFGRNTKDCNVLAVTGACLMVAREHFQEAGGMCAELKVAFNDVDLCFKLWKLGYQNVVINSSSAWHHESLSRGNDEAKEKLNRLRKERRILYERQKELSGWDPYYPQGLSGEFLDTGIRFSYLTGGNCLQEGEGAVVPFKEEAAFREDPCLMIRIERCDSGIVTGWCCVLGDDNACYDKYLLFKDWNGKIERLLLEGQYRPDLEENMPDQKNVALSGFEVHLPEAILSGKLLGAAAVNRVTGLKLLSFSNFVCE